MLCPVCRLDKHPSIELVPRGGARFVCGNGACHTDLGPVENPSSAVPGAAVMPDAAATGDEGLIARNVAKAIASQRSAPVAAPATSTVAPAPAATPAAQPLVGPGLVARIASRIEEIDAQLTGMRALETERAELERMLRAATKAPRRGKARLSVVSPVAQLPTRRLEDVS